MIEDMLRDLGAAEPNWNISILRYFNPAGRTPVDLSANIPAGAQQPHALYRADRQRPARLPGRIRR